MKMAIGNTCRAKQEEKNPPCVIHITRANRVLFVAMRICFCSFVDIIHERHTENHSQFGRF